MFTTLYKKVQRIEDNKAAKENVILVVRHKRKVMGEHLLNVWKTLCFSW